MYRRVCFLVCFIFFFLLCADLVNAQDDDLLLKGDMKKAYASYNNAFLNEQSAYNYLNMCRVTHSLNDNKSAKRYCMKALNVAESENEADEELKSDILAALGNIYQEVYHNNFITLDYYKQAELLKTKNISTTDKYELAELYRNMGRTYFLALEDDLALEYWRKALENKEDSEKYKLLEASVLYDMADFEIANKNKIKAAEYLDKAVGLLDSLKEYKNPKLEFLVYLNYAKCYENDKKNKDKYIYLYQKAAIQNDKFPYDSDEENIVAIADMSMDELESLYEFFPYDIDVNLELGFRNLSLSAQMADEYFSEAVNVNPHSAYTYLGIASAYSEQYLKTGNKEYLYFIMPNIRKAVARAPYSPGLYKGIGNLSLLLDVNAEPFYDKYAEYSLDKASAHCDIASNYWEISQNKKTPKMVIKHVKKALKITPDIDEPYIRMLVSSYRQKGDNNKAEDIIEKYLRK